MVRSSDHRPRPSDCKRPSALYTDRRRPSNLGDHPRSSNGQGDSKRPSDLQNNLASPSDLLNDHTRPSDLSNDHARPCDLQNDRTRRPSDLPDGHNKRPLDILDGQQRRLYLQSVRKRPPEAVADRTLEDPTPKLARLPPSITVSMMSKEIRSQPAKVPGNQVILKRLYWKELTSGPVGLTFHGLDALCLCSSLKSRAQQQTKKKKIMNICFSFSEVTSIYSGRVKSALTNVGSFKGFKRLCSFWYPICLVKAQPEKNPGNQVIPKRREHQTSPT